MSEHTGICIVWPAHFDGSVDPELHVTALFLGHTDTAAFTKSQVRNAMAPWLRVAPGTLSLKPEVQMFGREGDVPVLLVANDPGFVLGYMVDAIAYYLRTMNGIERCAEFGFNPHVTIGKEPARILDNLPKTVHLECPVLWWGNERELHSKHKASVSV
jgi:hypothetical protein